MASRILHGLPRALSWSGWLASPCANNACPAASVWRPNVPALLVISLESSPSSLKYPFNSAIMPIA